MKTKHLMNTNKDTSNIPSDIVVVSKELPLYDVAK